MENSVGRTVNVQVNLCDCRNCPEDSRFSIALQLVTFSGDFLDVIHMRHPHDRKVGSPKARILPVRLTYAAFPKAHVIFQSPLQEFVKVLFNVTA